MKRLYFVTLLMAVLYITGCSVDSVTESAFTTKGTPVIVTLPFSIAAPTDAGNVTTRSIPSGQVDKTGVQSDNYVKNLWVLQFEGSGTSAILKKSSFVSGDNITFAASTGIGSIKNMELLTGSDIGKNQLLLLVANVSQGDAYSWPALGTSLSEVLDVTRSIASEADTHATLDSKETLLMSGIVSSSSGTGGFLSQTLTLKRSIVKLTVTLTISDGCVIDSVKIGGVPTVLPLAAASMFALKAPSLYPSVSTAVIDYPTETTFGNSGNGSEDKPYTWTWYLPCNLKGTSGSTSNLDKTKDAPTGATSIKIYATNSDTEARSIFTLYPGADLIKDYNLRSNHDYIFHFTLNGCGLEGSDNDSREEVIGTEVIDYTLKADDANCYMLHPNPAGGKNRIYYIPIALINKYWRGTAEGYGAHTTGYSGYDLGSNETWSASVLWSDMPTITTSTPIKVSGTFTGTRTNDYFKVTIPAGTEPGNFVVAVKDASNHILWSWHLWVTEYDPDQWIKSGSLATPGQTYQVSGGQVENYGTTVWQSGGLLYGKMMMDRTLGALKRGDAVTPYTRGMLYYEFGRKDPFPASLNGTDTIQFASGRVFRTQKGGAKLIVNAVLNPTTYYLQYTGTPPSRSWTSDASSTLTSMTYLWYDSNAIMTGETSPNNLKKSIYDPCPLGWRLPETGIEQNTSPWENFTMTDLNNYAYGFTGHRSFNNNYVEDLGTPGSVWYDGKWHEGYGNTYPTDDKRKHALTGHYWSAVPQARTGISRILMFGFVYHPESGNWSFGNPEPYYDDINGSYGYTVRCSQE